LASWREFAQKLRKRGGGGGEGKKKDLNAPLIYTHIAP